MNVPHAHYLLPDEPCVPQTIHQAVCEDYERFTVTGHPQPIEDYLAERYGLDLSAQYAGLPLRNPWGKASGQLSMTAHQVAEDVAAGLGFVVLKTVIAEDPSGARTMGDWAVQESRMLAEPIVGSSGQHGWTVNWKGRGWWQPLEDYLQLVRDARRIAAGSQTLIVPSCKFHLPGPGETGWNIAEYEYTTRQLLGAWNDTAAEPRTPMPLEKDFSPTLAGSDRAQAQGQILGWLREVPRLVREAAATTDGAASIRLGLKVFNALFDDEFQLDMLRTIHDPTHGPADFYVYANRLFDPHRSFDGRQGIAYGGPDLSDRNLRVMSRFQRELSETMSADRRLPWSATGNIASGKMALEYALCGASSFQIHTFFQLPADQYRMQIGSKVQKALHELYFHPCRGLIIWMHDVAGRLGLAQPIRLRDIAGKGSVLRCS